MLATLRSVMRLPQQLMDGVRAMTDVARQLSGLQRVVTDRLASLDARVRDALALLPAIAADLERVRATVEPQHERVAAIERALDSLPALLADVEGVRGIVEAHYQRVVGVEQAVAVIDGHLSRLQETLSVLRGEVEDATERLPDPDAPGPLRRARETLTGRA